MSAKHINTHHAVPSSTGQPPWRLVSPQPHSLFLILTVRLQLRKHTFYLCTQQAHHLKDCGLHILWLMQLLGRWNWSRCDTRYQAWRHGALRQMAAEQELYHRS